MKDWIFITGGCGFIGSHLAALLKDTTDYNIMLIDRRAKELVHTQKFADIFADEDFASPVALGAIQDYKPKALIHLAADSTVGPSMENPYGCWENNVVKTISLLDCCQKHDVKNVIFASSSAVYADQDYAVDELSQLMPCSPYATSKMVVELALKDWFVSHKLSSIAFRFFNVAGAHPRYDLGELNGSSHLLAKVMESAVHGHPFTVFGRDWPTADGTGIRDYTHVMDIANAIAKGIEWLPSNPGCYKINLGGGQGHSVQSVIDATEMLLNKQLPYRYGPRRAGDSAMRYSNNDLAENLLGWTPSHTMQNMILDSYKWYNSDIYDKLTRINIKAH